MPQHPTYLEVRVPKNSPEQEQAIAKLTAQGWKLVACILDAEAPGDVLLTFTENRRSGSRKRPVMVCAPTLKRL
jgi:hypothetical protein